MVIGNVLRKLNPDRHLECFTYSVHERYQSNLASLPMTFWMAQAPGIKTWNHIYAPLPINHHILPSKTLPDYISPDCVWSQNKFAHWEISSNIAQQYGIPLISLEHCLPLNWGKPQILQWKQMRGDVNVFISEYSRREWLWGDEEAEVIHHGVDTNIFSPNGASAHYKGKLVLSVVNDWINRTIPCGYHLWKEVAAGLPVQVVGDTPGLSKPASSVKDLVQHYNNCRVFLNTSLISPIPSVLLESAACGAAIVSTSNCMIPEIFTHEYNAYLSNDPKTLRKYCEHLLQSPDECDRIGKNARETILKHFSLEKFVENWSNLFRRICNG